MVIKTRTDPRTQETVFVLAGPPERVYSRIVGGICWPGPESRSMHSALCVLGEERDKDFTTAQRFVRVISEVRGPSVEELLDVAAEMTETHKVQAWAMQLDAPEMHRVRSWQRERGMRRISRLTLVNPASVDFQVLHNLALKRTGAYKTMFFGDNSLAATQYVGVRPEDFYRPPRNFPHVAAALYALSLIDMRQSAAVRHEVKRNEPAEGGY